MCILVKCSTLSFWCLLQVKCSFVQPNQLTDLAKLSDKDISSFELDFSDITFMTGGTVFNALNTNEILKKTGVKAIVQAYGSTEQAGLAAFDGEDNYIPGSAGLLAPNFHMKVIMWKTEGTQTQICFLFKFPNTQI